MSMHRHYRDRRFCGWVEALKSLVRGLSSELPAAVFVVLHVGARPSILPDLLRQDVALPVEHGIDKAPIENGRYVVIRRRIESK